MSEQDYPIRAAGVPILQACDACIPGHYEWDNSCGAKVCIKCEHHQGLARCFCGWAADGGDGYRQLLDMGEQIEPD